MITQSTNYSENYAGPYPLNPLVAQPRSLKQTNNSSKLIGMSAEMLEVFRLAKRVGQNDVTVLLRGEPGCGKESIAQLIHSHSERAQAPFVAIECSEISSSSIEDELFGNASGCTGAFERAAGGTLMLSGITTIPRYLQTRLLRVIETHRYCRVGGKAELKADTRIIIATDESNATRDAELSADILYRLAVFPIEIPPLRERGEDVILLAEYFLSILNAREGTHKKLSARSREIISQHTWPGNVRELKLCVGRAYILGDDIMELEPMIDNETTTAATTPAGADFDRLQIRVGARIDEVERYLIEATLNYFQGNKRRAAGVLGCSVKTLYNKLNEYSRKDKPAKAASAPTAVASDNQLPA